MTGHSPKLRDRRSKSAWCGEYKAVSSTASTSSTPAHGLQQPDAGIHPKAEGWSTLVATTGAIIGVNILVFGIAFLGLWLALAITVLESIRDFFRLDALPERKETEDSEDSKVTLVLPGICSYVFWQLGMIQYICEHFDTSNVKLAGVSSGAISSVVLLHFEEIASAATSKEPSAAGQSARMAVRQRAHELFAYMESVADMKSPLSFLGSLRPLLENAAKQVIPKSIDAASSRLCVGVRRLARGACPAMVPYVVANFSTTQELQDAVLASSHVWPVVSLTPLRDLPGVGACSDGVNPYSLFCFYDYARQLISGQSKTSAPSCMIGSPLDIIYVIWNCTVMKALLSPKDQHVWISPTVGGRLKVLNLLRFSNWFMGHQWQEGYAHARDLDAEGYLNALTRRPGT